MSKKEITSKFIVGFLGAIFDFSKNFPKAFIRESWHYKDLRMAGYDPKIIYNNLHNLGKRGILKSYGNGIFSMTNNGIGWAKTATRRYFKFKDREWDHMWRIIIFDIPQELDISRTRFRRKLKSLGFYMLQKSVFVFPYPCEEELVDLCSRIGVGDYIDIIVADSVGFKEKEICDFFSVIIKKKI